MEERTSKRLGQSREARLRSAAATSWRWSNIRLSAVARNFFEVPFRLTFHWLIFCAIVIYTAPMEALRKLIDIALHLDRYLKDLVPEYGLWIYAILFLIVFCETGLVV